MNLEMFPLEWLELPDDELGYHLLAVWAGYHAQKLNIPIHLVTFDFVEAIRSQTLKMDTDNVEHVALEKAIKLIAEGQPARGGKLFREHMKKGATFIAALDEAVTGRRRQTANAKKPRTTPFQQLIINLITKDPNMTENALEHALKKQEGVTFTPDDMIIYKKQKPIPRTALKDHLFRAKKKINSR